MCAGPLHDAADGQGKEYSAKDCGMLASLHTKAPALLGERKGPNEMLPGNSGEATEGTLERHQETAAEGREGIVSHG